MNVGYSKKHGYEKAMGSLLLRNPRRRHCIGQRAECPAIWVDPRAVNATTQFARCLQDKNQSSVKLRFVWAAMVS